MGAKFPSRWIRLTREKAQKFEVPQLLPIGAPTSSAIGNFVLWSADKKIEAACHAAEVVYTRWVDDLYLSGRDAVKMIGFAMHVLRAEGFRINRAKILVRGPGERHVVAGLVVNGLRPTVPREFQSRVRAEIARLKVTSGAEHDALARSIQGSLAYLVSSNPTFVRACSARLKRVM